MLLPEKRIIPLTASSLTSLTTRPTDPPRGSTWFNMVQHGSTLQKWTFLGISCCLQWLNINKKGHFQMTNWATEHGKPLCLHQHGWWKKVRNASRMWSYCKPSKHIPKVLSTVCWLKTVLKWKILGGPGIQNITPSSPIWWIEMNGHGTWKSTSYHISHIKQIISPSRKIPSVGCNLPTEAFWTDWCRLDGTVPKHPGCAWAIMGLCLMFP